jgi:glycosyltransferase involved in cell wall biosynthesis
MNKYHGLVSIITPSYNTAKFIVKTIQSVVLQTYPFWEMIIVDDCSTDNTLEIVRNYIDNYHEKRIKLLVNKNNCGAAISRNKALRESKGNWIAFLDSDDLWKPEKLASQISFMEENDYMFSYTIYERIDENDKNLHIFCSGPETVTKRKMYQYCYPGCLTVMYDANKIGIVQVENIKKNNDYAIWLKICKKANCYLLKENLASYRVRKNSISHDSFFKKFKSHLDLFHICDEKPIILSLWFSCWNMFFGLLKKQKYEIVEVPQKCEKHANRKYNTQK